MTHVENWLRWYEGWRSGYTQEAWDEMWAHSNKALEKVEFVRSHYRAPWYGVVSKREKRKGLGDLLTIRVLKDRRGNWVRKPWTTTLDEAWTTPCKGWRDELSPYNTGIPILEIYARKDRAEKVKHLRRLRKYIKAQWKGRA